MTYRYGVAIIGESKNIEAFHANRRTGQIAYVENMTGKSIENYAHSPYTRLYWAEDKASADALAKDLGERHPSYTYVVFESKECYQRAPGPITKSVFSDKGLLPE